MDIDRSRLPDPAEVRRCLFMRALEEADPAGERLPMTDRVAASAAVADRQGFDFVRARTEQLGSRLKGPSGAAFAGIGRIPHAWPAWLGLAVGVAAFLLGWFTHDLGPDGRVSLLAFPLLGLIVWNLAVVAASLLTLKKRPAANPQILPTCLQRKPSVTGDAFTDAVLARTEQEWQLAQAPLLMARVKQLFHVGALMLAAGVVAGMYARGLVRNYQAGWESTFLTQPAVSKLTRIVLGPASVVTGVPVPLVPPQGGLSPAAPWIHLWAASAGLFILVPRLLLISMTRREAKKAGETSTASFSDYETTARRLAGGQPLVAWVLPMQGAPDSPLRDSLRAVLQHLWGGQVMVDFLPAVEYGGEDECLAALMEPPTHLVLLMPLAVTPEDEVHGTLQRGLEKLLATAAVPPFALTVLDATTFEARLAGLPEAARRMAERRAVWEKTLGPAWPLLFLDSAARRNPAAAAGSVAAARQPLRLWTAPA